MESCHYLRNTIERTPPTSCCPPDQTVAQPRLARIDVVTVSLAVTWIFGLSPQVSGTGPARSAMALVERTVTQDQGAWVVDYHLRNTARTGVIVTSEDLRLRIEGWVSNSRVASHAVPRWSSLFVSPSVAPTAFSEVLTAVDESHRCRERMVVSVWAEEQPQSNSGPASKGEAPPRVNGTPVSGSTVACFLPLSLGPGETMHIRLHIEHQHILYGDFDPLLGVRILELTLGSSVVRDLVPLDREQYLAQPKYTWPEPPEERRDTRHFISAPDSLHLEADVPGHQTYRYQERPVRYNTKMRLLFWYLIAAGTEGECRVRVGQNKDTPLAWRQLHEAGFEDRLKSVGRWTRYERIVLTEPEATRLILEFKIVGEIDVGEMWIDDVSVESVGSAAAGGP